MVKVVQRGRFRVYVWPERGQQHHLPHCHVFWSDGESVVALDTSQVLAGPDLPAEARDLIREHRSRIRRAWRRLNPKEQTE
jgi:hypothetical protein